MTSVEFYLSYDDTPCPPPEKRRENKQTKIQKPTTNKQNKKPTTMAISILWSLDTHIKCPVCVLQEFFNAETSCKFFYNF